jgi:hypothetical protein
MKISYFLPLFAFIFLCMGCMDTSSVSQETIDPVIEQLGPAPITITRHEIVGSGRLLATSVLRSSYTNFHLKISGNFLSADSQMTLHVFFDDFQYDTGILLRMSLAHDYLETGDINVEFAEPGRSYLPLTTLNKVVGNDLSFVLRIEAHNKFNNERRLLIWNDALFLDSRARETRDRLTLENADFDSLNSGNIIFSWGQGYHWGLHLRNMRINTLMREVPVADQ